MLFSVCIIYVTAIAFMYFTNKLIIIFIIIKRTKIPRWSVYLLKKRPGWLNELGSWIT